MSRLYFIMIAAENKVWMLVRRLGMRYPGATLGPRQHGSQ